MSWNNEHGVNGSALIKREYYDLSEKNSTATAIPQNQLLILDLNGTLCSRTRTTPKTFYTRPHAVTFFDYIFQNFTVMVWSSAREISVQSMCTMFAPHVPSIIWHRGHLGLSQQDFYSNVEAVKNLDKVWNTYPQFNAKNTLVLDDTPFKLSAQPYNLILMRTFNHVSLEPEGECDLLKAIQYLSLIRNQANVCQFMRYFPFDYAFDWGIVPNPTADTHMNHFVNGRNINPGVKSTLEDQLNELGQSPEELFVLAKAHNKKSRKKARTALRKREKKNALINDAVKTDTIQPLDNLQYVENSQLTENTQAINIQPTAITQPIDTSQPINTAQAMDDMQSIDTTQSKNYIQPTNTTQPIDTKHIISSTMDMLREVLRATTDTMVNWGSRTNQDGAIETTNTNTDTNIPETIVETVNIIREVVPTTDNVGMVQEPSISENNMAQEYSISANGIEGISNLTEESMDLDETILPNPFEKAYNNAFPPKIAPKIVPKSAPKSAPKSTPKSAPKYAPKTGKVNKSNKPNKPKKPKKPKETEKVNELPQLDPIALLRTKPVKSILKSTNGHIRIGQGSQIQSKTLAKLEAELTAKREQRRLRQEKKSGNSNV